MGKDLASPGIVAFSIPGIRGPAGGQGTPKAPKPLKPEETFPFAGVYFAGVEVDRQAKEIRLPSSDITPMLYQRLTRRELDRVAQFCHRAIVAKDSPMAVVAGVRRPFASFLLEQVELVIAGGPREY